MAYFSQQLINGHHARRHLRPDRHRLHDGLRHHRHDQLRPRRSLHDRRLHLPDRLHDLRHAGHQLGAASRSSWCCCSPWLFTAIYGWAIERIAYRPLRGSFRLAPLISAIGMSIVLQNYVQLVQGARLKPMRPHRRRRLHAVQRRRLRRALTWLQIIIVVVTRGADGGLLLADRRARRSAAAARLRAGHEDGVAARRRCRPHDLAHLRHGRGAGRRRRPDVPAVLRRRSISSSASWPASRPSPPRCWAASARCPAPCWAGC